MALPQHSTTATVSASIGDLLHHICAVHPDAEDDPACVAGLGCRSLCGRDISGESFADGPLSGEQECLVCAEMDT